MRGEGEEPLPLPCLLQPNTTPPPGGSGGGGGGGGARAGGGGGSVVTFGAPVEGNQSPKAVVAGAHR
jgi:hypothetical protein